MAAKASSKAEAVETRDENVDGPLLDGVTAAVKKMLARSKERGYVTYAELNSVLTQDTMSSEQIEQTLSLPHEMGITVVDGEEQDEAAEAAAAQEEDASRIGGRFGKDRERMC